MEFKFKIQEYQTDAVENTVKVFEGQPWTDITQYRRDLGKQSKQTKMQFDDDDCYMGYRNADVELTKEELLQNIREMQKGCQINMSKELCAEDGLGSVSLDIDMETGTGKTYVYIKTMFELNKRYGWSKFIVVIPSVAIREGVYKSFQTLEKHFMQYYDKKARFFIYNSKNLQLLDAYSSDPGINVMIINSQAFAGDMKETVDKKTGDKKYTKAGLIIYSKRDEFASRRPIDVIRANRPIIIMDEPQRMEGKATQAGLKKFHPLFVLNYSATHKTKHNCVYALDALDAYRQKLVKKIEVKGIQMANLPGSTGYIYFDHIILSKTQAPMAMFEVETNGKTGIVRQTMKLGMNDNIKHATGLNQYDGLVISDIDPVNNRVTFLNGTSMVAGQAAGDKAKEEIQRIQIRETIESHFEKERDLYNKGIKCLSLFFIDEVANYKSYDEDGNEVHGPLWKVFEQEYIRVFNEYRDLFEDDYLKYLEQFKAEDVHLGYFAIDKKGRSINTKEDSDEAVSAYDLILKNKEALLDFNTKTRFIFSHSALREGWDNPNVFQICTLRNGASVTAKRQEIGRGLRICVDKNGNRQDKEAIGDLVHEINTLTVVANDSYEDFVKGLQDETRQELRERPAQATVEFFTDKAVIAANGKCHRITKEEASIIFGYLVMNGYADMQGNVTDAYTKAKEAGTLQPAPALADNGLDVAVHELMVQIVNPEKAVKSTMSNGKQTVVKDSGLNANFHRREFQELWKQINHKYVYTVHYDSEELIKNCIQALHRDLKVRVLSYVVKKGLQTDADKFTTGSSTYKKETGRVSSSVTYDLVGDIAKGASLTRRTVQEILKGVPDLIYMFVQNPEEFIRNVVKIIREQKSTMIVEHIEYDQTTDTYDSDIFTQQKPMPKDKALKTEKHITDYLCEGNLAATTEDIMFARELEQAPEVAVYAKLPRTFYIPTPVGNYYPDWAIAFKEGDVKHVFFVAETTGYVNSMQISDIEKAREDCAAKLFKKFNSENLVFHRVTSYEDIMKELKKA